MAQLPRFLPAFVTNVKLANCAESKRLSYRFFLRLQQIEYRDYIGLWLIEGFACFHSRGPRTIFLLSDMQRP